MLCLTPEPVGTCCCCSQPTAVLLLKHQVGMTAPSGASGRRQACGPSRATSKLTPAGEAHAACLRSFCRSADLRIEGPSYPGVSLSTSCTCYVPSMAPSTGNARGKMESGCPMDFASVNSGPGHHRGCLRTGRRLLQGPGCFQISCVLLQPNKTKKCSQ